MSSVTSELMNLEVDFLKALTTSNIEGLPKFNQDLPSFVTRAGEACSSGCTSGSVSEDEAKLHLLPAHNIQVFASCVAKVELALDALCRDFSNHLKFSLLSAAPSVINPPSRATPSGAISDSHVTMDGGSSAASQSLLKTWCQEHLSALHPTKIQRAELASRTSMSENQVMLWFRNARARSGWTKLYAHVQKDAARLKMLIEEFHSLTRLHGHEEAKQVIARDEGYQLVEKVLRWFETEKKCIKSASPKFVRPWVKEVISSTLENLKRSTPDARGSSNSTLAAFSAGWDSSSESYFDSFTGRVASTSSLGPTSRSSSPQPSSSRSTSSSIRSTSPVSTNTSVSSFPTDSQAPSTCSSLSSDQTSNFPPLPVQLFDYSSPEPFSSPLCIPTNDSSSPVTSIVSGDLPASSSEPPSLFSGLASLQGGNAQIEVGQFDDALED